MSAIQETVYLQRGTRSDVITPDVIADRPEKALSRLVEGYNWLNTGAISSYADQDYYASTQNKWRSGNYGYNVTLVVPPELKNELSDVMLVPLGENGEVPLAEVPAESRVYEKCFLPEERAAELLPYAIIYGGPADGSEQFRELHFGQEARAHMQTNESVLDSLS